MRSRLGSLGLAAIMVATAGCGSSGSKTGTGGTAGASTTGTGGHAGAAGNGGLAGAAGGAAGGAGGAAGSTAGAGGQANGGAGGSAGGAAGAAGSTAGAGGHANGGAGGSAVQAADFSIDLGSSAAISLPPGGSQVINITIDRNKGATAYTPSIMFSLSVPNTITGNGVTATFAPNPATAGSTMLTVNVGTTGAASGVYQLQVVAVGGTGASAETATANLQLTVTAPKTTLLIDNDFSANNDDPTDTTQPASPSDTAFATLLQGNSIAYNTFIEPSGSTGTALSNNTLDHGGPNNGPYTTIVYYTGDSFGSQATLSPADELLLESWLDEGGHTLLVFSENLVYDLGHGDWVTPEDDTSDSFLADYIGAAGDAADGSAVNHVNYTATGVAGTAFATETFKVAKDYMSVGSTADVINPATGTDPLVTVMENPHDALAAAAAVPSVVGRKGVGAKKTSTVVYVGMPIEDIVATSTSNSSADFFLAVLKYAGLK